MFGQSWFQTLGRPIPSSKVPVEILTNRQTWPFPVTLGAYISAAQSHPSPYSHSVLALYLGHPPLYHDTITFSGQLINNFVGEYYRIISAPKHCEKR